MGMGQTGSSQIIEYKEENLYIGNTQKKCDQKYYDHKEAYDWTMFISSSKDKLIKPESIKQVTYYLHKTFKKSTQIVKKAPFTLKRRGWGYFLVKAKIEFLDKYNRKDLYCSHMLDLYDPVTMTHINTHNTMDDDRIPKEKDLINSMMINREIYSSYDAEIHHSENYNNFIIQAIEH